MGYGSACRRPAGRSCETGTDEFLADVQRYADLGVTEVQVMPDRHPVEFAEQIAQRVMPGLARI
ncbi:MAG TPA: hypothetical protein VFO16_02905 [Pseudonocardiaceae bacterium]|nr:hypothetical protein [Pseudonocardiaceae bacterium]